MSLIQPFIISSIHHFLHTSFPSSSRSSFPPFIISFIHHFLHPAVRRFLHSSFPSYIISFIQPFIVSSIHVSRATGGSRAEKEKTSHLTVNLQHHIQNWICYRKQRQQRKLPGS
eukprot:GHVU01044952.1.p4 GENE.GHVU01044952.1~~GHVU01044952.1.p4  ORF type:complete len:114 (+),score=8.56 GHVU01044952.1:46-387(+)